MWAEHDGIASHNRSGGCNVRRQKTNRAVAPRSLIGLRDFPADRNVL